MTRSTFSTDNGPVDTVKWKGFDRSKERFKRQEPDDGWNFPKMIDTPGIVGIFYRNAFTYWVATEIEERGLAVAELAWLGFGKYARGPGP